ncbi:hypothetical protein BC629DRAFT_866260 [Irpex lacteus]|nr:hypothetical protein BC629DRAFT_866260 [Irpex lacteus]
MLQVLPLVQRYILDICKSLCKHQESSVPYLRVNRRYLVNKDQDILQICQVHFGVHDSKMGRLLLYDILSLMRLRFFCLEVSVRARSDTQESNDTSPYLYPVRGYYYRAVPYCGRPIHHNTARHSLPLGRDSRIMRRTRRVCATTIAFQES